MDDEQKSGIPSFDFSYPENTTINIRVDEMINPGKFKKDPLIPGGYLANSLTIRAMRLDIFVMGNSIDELKIPYLCSCGNKLDLQFWKLCPYCARDINE